MKLERVTLTLDGSYDEWLRLFATRDEFAPEYAAFLWSQDSSWPGWKPLNEAIIKRWSPAALRYIKQKAWKMAVR